MCIIDSPMKRINYHLTEKQIQTLKDYSKETGLSLAEIVRRAIDKFFEILLESKK